MTAVRVEELPLPARVEEALLVALAVDLDERSGGRREATGGHGLVVDACRGAARGRHLADAHERLREPVEQRLDAAAAAPWRTSPGPRARRVRAPARR